jgi:hypothetical protein
MVGKEWWGEDGRGGRRGEDGGWEKLPTLSLPPLPWPPLASTRPRHHAPHPPRRNLRAPVWLQPRDPPQQEYMGQELRGEEHGSGEEAQVEGREDVF